MEPPSLAPVRTVTTFVTLRPGDVAQWESQIRKAKETCTQLERTLAQTLNLTVQTTRIATNSFEEYIPLQDPTSAVTQLQKLLQKFDVKLFNVGPATSQRGIEVAALMVKQSSRISASAFVQPANLQNALQVADAILSISRETQGGEGNFRFCASANVPPGIPFFPAAYHDGSPISFAIGLETSGCLHEALQIIDTSTVGNERLALVADSIRRTFEQSLRPIRDVARQASHDVGVPFRGIDASLAPSPETPSIVDSMSRIGLGKFGTSGTLATCAFLTGELKKLLDGDVIGYTGLMLPILEDRGLARLANEGAVTIHELLMYSSVCGLGLDCVPIPGDSDRGSVAHLLLDVSALAHRKGGPLTARLFPIPGKVAGERTSFSNPHLCDCAILNFS